jgi:hypothetical protein
MGISLTGLTPATTYDALIKVGDNGPITSALKVLSDGLGTNLPMEASTTGVNFTGTLQQSGVAVPTASQVAAKQDTLVSGTNIKTVNSTTILGSGNLAVQDVLVSGTNIKTINGTSVLGSGNIVTPSTPPSGVSGAIQFSDGSAFASDATKFFWDNTNKRLGIGTATPSLPVDILGGVSNGGLKVRAGNTTSQNILDIANNAGTQGFLYRAGDNVLQYYGYNFSIESQNSNSNILLNPGAGSGQVQINGGSGGRLSIKGSGSTSATTSLLVQNSAGTQLLQVRDDNLVLVQNLIVNGYVGNVNSGVVQIGGGGTVSANAYFNAISESFGFGVSSINASAKLQIDSTIKGFLPPRLTTTQKNAIASPAAGLVVYDSTTNKLCCYNGSTWNDLF